MTKSMCVELDTKTMVERGIMEKCCKYYYKYYPTYEGDDERDDNESLLNEIYNKYSISYLIDPIDSSWDQEDKDELLETIRLISRKNAIGVVSRGNGALPISRQKNLGNIDILLQFENGGVKSVITEATQLSDKSIGTKITLE